MTILSSNKKTKHKYTMGPLYIKDTIQNSILIRTILKLSIKDKYVHTVILTMNEEKVFIKINKQNIIHTCLP